VPAPRISFAAERTLLAWLRSGLSRMTPPDHGVEMQAQ